MTLILAPTALWDPNQEQRGPNSRGTEQLCEITKGQSPPGLFPSGHPTQTKAHPQQKSLCGCFPEGRVPACCPQLSYQELFGEKPSKHCVIRYDRGQRTCVGSCQDSKRKPTILGTEEDFHAAKGRQRTKSSPYQTAVSLSCCFNGSQTAKSR